MKKVLIMIFLSISTFFIISAFVTKGFNKEPITFNYVLVELEKSDIGFDIKKDIDELASSLQNLNSKTTNNNTDVLSTLTTIANTVYYFGRFALKMIVHTIVSTLNVIILVLRCIGFTTIEYIKLIGSDEDVQVVDDWGWITDPNIK